jgi:hypothetical protein
MASLGRGPLSYFGVAVVVLAAACGEGAFARDWSTSLR